MKVHFIAIGGSAMHSLAIAMHNKGYEVTGSDDAFFDPSKTSLKSLGLLPESTGWYPQKLTKNIDAVIVGMHARADNPELLEAQKLGLTIYSYPEYLYEQTKNKTRIVVGGSHGKTTTTLMIMHVLQQAGIQFDYMAGAKAEGFTNSVSLSEESTVAVFEGDEYLTSPMDLTPKFHHYYPDIAIITGIAWDHMNVFPTFENYVRQFEIFTEKIEKDGSLIWFEEDEEIKKVAGRIRSDIQSIPYHEFKYKIANGITSIELNGHTIKLSIFGLHNLQNLKAAYHACAKVGIADEAFLKAIASFKGANKRLQLIAKTKESFAYLDFAHSPSKVEATLKSVKRQFEKKRIVACFELHTFSSLNKDFLPQYKNTLAYADSAYVYYSPDVVAHKKLDSISKEEVVNSFAYKGLQVLTTPGEMKKALKDEPKKDVVYLFMTSGTFGGTDLAGVCNSLLA